MSLLVGMSPRVANAEVVLNDGDFGPGKVLVQLHREGDPQPAGHDGQRGTPTGTTATSCVVTALPNDGSTSGNGRAPSTRRRSIKTVYLITAAELAANGVTAGTAIAQIGWSYNVDPGVSGAAPLAIYLENTADATYSKGTSFTAAIAPMTKVHDAVTTLPASGAPANGEFDIPFVGGSPFTYTGGGLYVAFNWGGTATYTGTLSTVAVIWCNSTGLVGGLATAQSTTAEAGNTMAVSSFRPETFLASTIQNDVSVDYIYALGKVPFGLVDPQVVSAVVTNNGAQDKANVSVTLSVTGADTFGDVQNTGFLAGCGGQIIVDFAAFTPSAIGNDVISVFVAPDDINSNNNVTKNMAVTVADYSYKHPGSTPVGGVGVNGNTTTLIARFPVTSATAVTKVVPEWAAASATSTWKIVLYDENGAQIYIDAADRVGNPAGSNPITLPSPVAVGPGDFYAGVQQTNTVNFGLSFDAESPIRAGAFFGEIPIGSGFFDFAPGNDFKFNLGVSLDQCDPTLVASSNTPVCINGTLQLFASSSTGVSYAWTGPNGFSSNLQNPTRPGMTALDAGTYTVTIDGCNAGSQTTDVTVVPDRTITASADPGATISPSGAVVVACAGDQTFSISVDACHTLTDVLVDNVSRGPVTSYTFLNVQTDHTIHAVAALINYTILSSAGPNGSIAPLGAIVVGCGANQGFTITPDVGFIIDDVVVDAVSRGAVASYTFNNVTANHTIAATFVVAPGTVDVGSSATYICPTHPCETLPVTISRSYSTPVLGYSVTIQLSPELTLCAGPGSITEGTFLNSAGPTSFNVISNGGGSYTVDAVVLGANCGPTATSGSLFNVSVASSSPSGPGSVSVTASQLRDCSNGPLAIVPGTVGTVPIDNAAPVVTVTFPNGGEVLLDGSNQTITWTATDNVGVANVDISYSTDGGTTYPNIIVLGAPNSGSYVWTLPTTPSTTARVRVTAHDVTCNTGSDDSDADFTIRDPVITASSGPNGSIAPSGAVSVPNGTTQVFTMSPAPCYEVANVIVDGSSVGAVTTYTFNNVTVDHTITASFSIIVYTVTTSPAAGSTITPSGAVGVNCGADQTFSIAVDQCHFLTDVIVDGNPVGPVTTYTFSNVQTNHTIATTVGVFQQTLTIQIFGSGSVNQNPNQATYDCGSPVQLTAVPAPGWSFVTWGGALSGPTNPNTVFMNGDKTVRAFFSDTQAPQVTVTFPNGGEILLVGQPYDFTWTATDNDGVTSVDLYVSRDNGATYQAIGLGEPNDGSFIWTVTPPGTNVGVTPQFTALFMVVAYDNAFNQGSDTSDAPFAIFDLATSVLVTKLNAETVDNGVAIKWALSGRGVFQTMELERADSEVGPWNTLSTQITEDGDLAVTAVDHTARGGQSYWYRLVGTMAGGQKATFGPVQGVGGSPREFALSSVWPNPMKDAMNLEFAVSREVSVKLSVLDIQGRQVQLLAEGKYQPGRYSVKWDGRTDRGGNAAAGIYFIRYQTPDQTFVKRFAISR